MLRVDLRELTHGPMDTGGEIAPGDPLLAGLDVTLAAPVQVHGRLQATGEDRYYWHGTLRTSVQAECRRCLVPVTVPVTAEVSALFTRDPDSGDDPDAYPLAPDATEIDLGPAVREELLLSAPRYVVCGDECKGLCPQCGTDLNTGACGCVPSVDPRWQPLRSLKDTLPS
ncbi:MAG: YceD family protein [Gemmatimonadales bacterium]